MPANAKTDEHANTHEGPLTGFSLGKQGSPDVLVQSIAGTAVGLLGELALEVIQTLQCLSHILQLEEAACQPKMSLQMGWVQCQRLQAVPQGIIMVTIPGGTLQKYSDTHDRLDQS